MKRGDIYYLNLDPTIGKEIKKIRPALIVSNNANNKFSETITVVPITSNIKKVYPFEVLLKKSESSLPKDSKAQCQQIRTVSIERISGKMVGRLSDLLISEINEAIKLHLSLE
ncbi:type II toxin-antitoxin system PemK/MazF family toxin [Fangia hongkongensis]|uniref:type II toxin-antitoxin system PemK/MazF family toxin n=2 Tax=Fangia hongkongensis TaxID=270495 RepID=UPI00037BBCF0|nr:type II toxin-antitoxin system PemK/MazF family toxin [Fangia hongkongensis]